LRGRRVTRSTIAAGTVQALRLTYQLRTNGLSVTTDRTTVAFGPTLPTWAMQQVGGYWGYTGRDDRRSNGSP